MRSTVARLSGAPTVVSDPLLTCVYYSVWTSLPARFECYERSGAWVAVIPTNDNQTIVATYLPQRFFADVRRDPEAAHRDCVRRTAPRLAERMVDAVRTERLRGTGSQHNFIRQASGPGWALVGDAGVHKDSITARGITDAFVQTDIFGDCAAVDLADPVQRAQALRLFGERRDKALANPYQNALALARLEVTPSRLHMLRLIAESRELTSTYFSVVAGLGSMNDLLVPELLARL